MTFYLVNATGKMVKIGKDQNAPWYTMTADILKNVSKQADGKYVMTGFKSGDNVAITYETIKGAMTLTGIKLSDAVTPTAPIVTHVTIQPTPTVEVAKPVTSTVTTPIPSIKKEWTPQGSGEYGKSPAVQESIKRQACAHATTRALHAMTGQFKTVEELAEAFVKLYDVVERKVSN